MNHTPGPWRLGEYVSWQVWTADRELCVATCMAGLGNSPGPLAIQANARLIAAAPELLEVCIALLDLTPILLGKTEADIVEKARRLARVAFDKATCQEMHNT